MPRPLVLASTSPYRRELLARFGLPFATASPGVDEAAFRAVAPDPFELAIALAAAKAAAVAARVPDAVVIGSDQVCALDGEILGKPGSVEAAVAQLRRLQGRTHELITAVSVRSADDVHAFHDVSRLRMRALDDAALRRYVARDNPIDCAGAYKLECAGIALFAAVETADATAITGLPLLQLGSVLRALGYPLP